MSEDPFEAAVGEAYTAAIAYQRKAREAVWFSPSRKQIAATIRPQYDRAVAAEAKLGEIRAVLLEGGQGDATARCRAIAIVGTGEETRDG